VRTGYVLLRRTGGPRGRATSGGDVPTLSALLTMLRADLEQANRDGRHALGLIGSKLYAVGEAYRHPWYTRASRRGMNIGLGEHWWWVCSAAELGAPETSESDTGGWAPGLPGAPVRFMLAALELRWDCEYQERCRWCSAPIEWQYESGRGWTGPDDETECTDRPAEVTWWSGHAPAGPVAERAAAEAGTL
jgi:hypothetical protein